MKKIEAIIKPFKLDEVKQRLTSAGITGMNRWTASGVISAINPSESAKPRLGMRVVLSIAERLYSN